MKRQKISKLLGTASLSLVLTLLGVSCGNDVNKQEKISQTSPQQSLKAVDTACAAQIFNVGRVIEFGELTRKYGHTKFSLESVQFRDVIFREPNDVDLAYRAEVKIEKYGRILQPSSEIVCKEGDRPSLRAQKLSRVSVPIFGDLHLPSGRITVYDAEVGRRGEDRDRLYNYPRMFDLSISSANSYVSFAEKGQSYRALQSLSEYVRLLKSYKHQYTNVELREMGEGRIAIYAEKDFSGERAQLLINLVTARDE